MSWNCFLYNNIIPLSSRGCRLYMSDIVHYNRLYHDVPKKNKRISYCREKNRTLSTAVSQEKCNTIYNYTPNIIIE